MVAPIPEHEFGRLVREHGCILRPTAKEFEIVTKEGQFVCSLAISHKKRGRREIKPVYVRIFLQAMKAIKEAKSKDK
jgi:hypothetical protein